MTNFNDIAQITEDFVSKNNKSLEEKFQEFHQERMNSDPGYFVDYMDRQSPSGCYLCPGTWLYEGKDFGPDVIIGITLD